MAILKLKGSVGYGSAKNGLPHNDPEDFVKVRNRFVELGYSWVSGATNPQHSDFIRLIKLFQCIISGHSKLDGGDGRIDLHGRTHQWLAAQNAPGWKNLEGSLGGVGWQIAEFSKGNSWTTTWMYDYLCLAGLYYRGLVALSSDVSDAPSMWVRDCSPREGGEASGHKSHQTGLDMDMRLPLLPPYTDRYDQLRGKAYNEKFHRKAAFLQARSIKDFMNTRYIFLMTPNLSRQDLPHTRKITVSIIISV